MKHLIVFVSRSQGNVVTSTHLKKGNSHFLHWETLKVKLRYQVVIVVTCISLLHISASFCSWKRIFFSSEAWFESHCFVISRRKYVSS